MKHAGGRPLKFQNPQQLQKGIDEYFRVCDSRVVERFLAKTGDIVMLNDPAPYTMAGLARSCGIDRDTLLRYSKKEEFYAPIKEARDKVQEDVERRLMETNATGAIFNLKNNFGYTDKTEVDQNIKADVTSQNKYDEEVATNFSDYLKVQTKDTDKQG